MTPTLELKPADTGYDTIYQRWLDTGQASEVEHLAEGWIYRAIRPNTTDTQPTFVLLASMPLTERDADGPPRGYAAVMGTRQSTLPGRYRDLPKT